MNFVVLFLLNFGFSQVMKNNVPAVPAVNEAPETHEVMTITSERKGVELQEEKKRESEEIKDKKKKPSKESGD